MNILVIESSERLTTEVEDSLNEIFNDPMIKILTTGDLTNGIGIMQPSAGKSPIDLVICAETVLEGFEGLQKRSNGLAFMKEYRLMGGTTPIIVLAEERPTEALVNDIYMIDRNTNLLERRLYWALNYFFPQLVH